MKDFARQAAGWGYDGYDAHWLRIARGGALASVAVDARADGRRYLSLNVLALTPAEAVVLRRASHTFGKLLDWATAGILEDRAWWSELAWPWPAVELARQEPRHPRGLATLYGRFDWLLDVSGTWKLVEYNADTPSGGREVSGLEPGVFRLHGGRKAGLERMSAGLSSRLSEAVMERLHAFEGEVGRPVGLVGVVSSHDWPEDMGQAWWLAGLIQARGQAVLVGDVRDLAVRRGSVSLRGRQIDALYRFYPIERLYRHGIFAPLMEAVIERRLLLLNGLRGFLAQSKTILAWLWENRARPTLTRSERTVIERHLPPTVPARSLPATASLAGTVVKHVNGREGDTVSFGEALHAAAWEERLLEGGYVVQQRVNSVPVSDIEVEELQKSVGVVSPRFACVGAYMIGGRFGGVYSRLDGPITTGQAAFVPTFVARDGAGFGQ